MSADLDFAVAGDAAVRMRALLRRDRLALDPEPAWLAAYLADDGGLRDVLGLLDWPGAHKLRPPLAGVAPVDLTAEASRGGRAGAMQRLSATLAVLTMVAAPDDPGGAKAGARNELGRHVAASRRLLIGWTPDGAAEPLAYVSGRLIDIEDGRVAWEDRYRASGWLEAVEGDGDD